MKKLTILAAAALMVTALTACGNGKSPDKMTISPGSFSEETQEVLKIIDDELLFFEYETDETVKSVSVDLWTYEEDEWINAGGTVGDLTAGGYQAAIRITDEACDIFQIDESGHTKSSYKSTVDFDASGLVVQSRLDNREPIVLNKEIILWVKLGTDNSSISSGVGQDFREADCNAGMAVTITFSDKIAE